MLESFEFLHMLRPNMLQFILWNRSTRTYLFCILCSNPSKSTTFCNMGSLRMLTTCLVIRFVANVYFIISVYNY